MLKSQAARAESSGRIGGQAGGVAVHGGFDDDGGDVAGGERDVADVTGIVGTKLHATHSLNCR